MPRIPIPTTRIAVCTARSLPEAKLRVAGRKRCVIPDRPRMRCLGVRNDDAGESSAHFREQVVETGAKRLRADDHSEGDKDDKHGIFGGGGTTLVNAKAIDQTEHFKFLLPVRPGPIASVCQRRSQSPLSRCAD